jgi:hypothetical protein
MPELGKTFHTYLFHFLLDFEQHQFHHNLILESKVMIKLQKYAHFGFFTKITNFVDFSFLKFKIDLELNFSKSEFANFVIIWEFDGFSSKTCKIHENTKTIQNIKL